MKQKYIVVLGGGESGVGAAILAKQKGYKVFLSDLSAIKPNYLQLLNEHDIPFEEKQHSEEKLLSADEVIKSPGIPDEAPLIQKFKKRGTPIVSEIEFAGRFSNAKMICITGSNGKTTTTMLTYHILKSAGLNVGLAGNVGNSLAYQVAKESFDYYVIELSSFQLDNMYKFKADIAILLNITPDHMDRYEHSFQKYIDAKFRILQNQTKTDYFIYWDNDPVIQTELKKNIAQHVNCLPFSENRTNNQNAFVEKNNFCAKIDNSEFSMPIENLALEGQHNLYNAMAATLVAKIVGIENKQIEKSLSDFQGVEHRLENVATINGIKYINDSKATNVNSCWYALQSMKTPVVLILGGKDKGNDYSEIDDLVKEKVKTLVFMGIDNSPLHKHFDEMGIDIIDTSSIQNAIEAATEAATEGDTILLSPCCASFDLFKSYEDRGTQFKQIVHSLEKK
jgi:UDP-N-acetylmuramoylalanine--D-glutamate ligase